MILGKLTITIKMRVGQSEQARQGIKNRNSGEQDCENQKEDAREFKKLLKVKVNELC